MVVMPAGISLIDIDMHRLIKGCTAVIMEQGAGAGGCSTPAIIAEQEKGDQKNDTSEQSIPCCSVYFLHVNILSKNSVNLQNYDTSWPARKKTGLPVWAIRLSNGARTRDFPHLPEGRVGFFQSAEYKRLLFLLNTDSCLMQ
jgi:hypothetical protein